MLSHNHRNNYFDEFLLTNSCQDWLLEKMSIENVEQTVTCHGNTKFADFEYFEKNITG